MWLWLWLARRALAVMPVPTWSAGQGIASADANNWFVPMTAFKTSDESVTSSTSMQNDNDLVLAPATNAYYQFLCFIGYNGGTQGSSDITWTWSVPAGSTLRYTWVGLNLSGGVQVGGWNTGGDTPAAGTNGTGNPRSVLMHGTLFMSGTAANLQFKWAQSSSNATATTVMAQSYVLLRRIG